MPDSDAPTYSHVVTPEAVRWAIDTLHHTTCHSSFLLYLFMRRRVVEGASPTNIQVDLGEIRPYVWVPGGPPNKPLFRPFSNRKQKNVAQFWAKDHLAGSYALSSLRAGSQMLLNQDSTAYELSVDHVAQARETFLSDKPISAVAMSAFLLRNFGFDLTCDDGHPEDLVAAFRQVFAFHPAHDADFDALFTSGVPLTTHVPSQWFDSVSLEAANA